MAFINYFKMIIATKNNIANLETKIKEQKNLIDKLDNEIYELEKELKKEKININKMNFKPEEANALDIVNFIVILLSITAFMFLLFPLNLGNIFFQLILIKLATILISIIGIIGFKIISEKIVKYIYKKKKAKNEEIIKKEEEKINQKQEHIKIKKSDYSIALKKYHNLNTELEHINYDIKKLESILIDNLAPYLDTLISNELTNNQELSSVVEKLKLKLNKDK